MNDDEAVDTFLQIIAQIIKRLADEDEVEENDDVHASPSHDQDTERG
jgi:hypothetical protein